jgi:hypothetical protein
MRIEIKELEGRDHFVVPMVMITEGVHNGSKGPIYYPPDQLRRSAPAWNGKPIVVYHPDMYANGFAGHPQVFNRQKVGTVFNAQFDGKRLKAEAWIDVQKVKRVDPRVYESIRQNKMVEVSTGLTFPNNNNAGTFNGEEFTMIAMDMQPDHLAILPDRIGACSIAKGAGLLRNQYDEEVLDFTAMRY